MRILVADDNRLVRRGVVGLLSQQENWEVCGEAADGNEAVRKARELLPDLVLLDISMPGLDGLEAATLLRREIPDIKILILSQHDPNQLNAAALKAGADGCCDKSRLAPDLLASIKKLGFN